MKKFPFLTREQARGLGYEYEGRTTGCEGKDFIAVTRTDDDEYDMHGFDSREELRNYIAETETEQSGWMLSAVYIKGKRVEVSIKIVVGFGDEL